MINVCQDEALSKSLMIRNFIRKVKAPGESLKWRTAQGFIVVLFGDAYLNVARLIGNLIMTRLLFPEAFGLMLVVNLLFTAITMLSDAGIRQSVIVHDRGRGREFLDTAWTLLVIRGAILSLVACALAYPISIVYEEAILSPMIVAASLSSLIRGFSSPNEFLYDRDVKKVRITILEVIAQTGSLVLTITWLWFYPSVWALVGMGIFSASIYAFLSYYFYEGNRPHFYLDRKYASEILHFGKWILLSTALTFLGSQGDKLIVSNWITTAELGLFSIAIGLAKIPEILTGSLCWKLLLPVYTELTKSKSAQFSSQIMKVELLLFLVCAPFVFGMTLFGVQLVDIMYDDRYLGAGWMLQIMAVGTIFTAFNETQIVLMIAHTHSFRSTVFQASRVALLLLSMSIGGALFGFVGLVYAISIAPALFYVILILFNMPHYKVSPLLQLSMIIFLLLVVGIGWNAMGWPGLH